MCNGNKGHGETGGSPPCLHLLSAASSGGAADICQLSDYLAVCCLPVSRCHLLCSARPSLPSTHPPDCEHRPRHSLVAAPCKDKYTKPINTRRPGSRGGWGGRLQVPWKPGEEGMGWEGMGGEVRGKRGRVSQPPGASSRLQASDRAASVIYQHKHDDRRAITAITNDNKR